MTMMMVMVMVVAMVVVAVAVDDDDDDDDNEIWRGPEGTCTKLAQGGGGMVSISKEELKTKGRAYFKNRA